MFIPHALIACAGRGERMRPLSDHTPKPLLPVRGKPLVVWHLEALARAGIRDVVINTAWLEDQFPAALGNGSRWGLRLHYAMEGRAWGGALETAGGMANALPQLAREPDDPFWFVSGDVFLPGFAFDAEAVAEFSSTQDWAHLWLTENAPHHPQGDFGLDSRGRVRSRLQGYGGPCLTWASVGLMRPALIASLKAGEKQALRPWLERGIAADRVSAQRLSSPWVDVGSPERLQALNEQPQEV
ncbi:nucleotidyltransferase family protein [Inhella gelatinilytica]|uniref:Nucleotidyltransferase family protein n=1 Tax=Inhella gelatinilytica TaxID=2795030 RepID=A0A931N9W3_9BURK|nr:nucleotidyltransferase family protein [Inhella gelatinilytica]MBH9551808.1 nucleotidyltransferase family protein [Inhella gelatinilytica]